MSKLLNHPLIQSYAYPVHLNWFEYNLQKAIKALKIKRAGLQGEVMYRKKHDRGSLPFNASAKELRAVTLALTFLEGKSYSTQEPHIQRSPQMRRVRELLSDAFRGTYIHKEPLNSWPPSSMGYQLWSAWNIWVDEALGT